MIEKLLRNKIFDLPNVLLWQEIYLFFLVKLLGLKKIDKKQNMNINK